MRGFSGLNETRRCICYHLLHDIADGLLTEGACLPTEMELARQFSTNRSNAHLAVACLREEGIVERNKRRGTYVVDSVKAKEAVQWGSFPSERVHVVADTEKSFNIHWDERTFSDLEGLLRDRGLTVVHESLTGGEDATAVRRLRDRVINVGSRAMVILPSQSETEVYLDNESVWGEYGGDIFLLNVSGEPLAGWPYHSIRFDPFMEGRIVANFLWENGYRRIAFATHKAAAYWSTQRLSGVCRTLRKLSDDTLRPEIIECEGAPPEVVSRLFAEFHRCSTEHPVLVAANDNLAARIMDAAAELGLHVPGDVSIIGFDDNYRYRNRDLTTVVPPLDSVAPLLVELVSDSSWKMTETYRVNIVLDSRLVLRGTCTSGGDMRDGVSKGDGARFKIDQVRRARRSGLPSANAGRGRMAAARH